MVTKLEERRLKRKLLEYSTWGKSDGEELMCETMFSSQRELDMYLEDNGWYHQFIGKLDFENPEEQTEYYDRDGGDWDEATGGSIVLTSYKNERLEILRQIEKLEEKLKTLEQEYM